jgi:MFS family permease
LIFLLGPVYSFFGGIDNPTRSALIANLVDRASLVNANALWQVLFQVGQVVGPAIAGILIARVGMSAVYYIAAGATLVAFVSLVRVVVPSRVVAPNSMSPSAMFDGLRYLRREQILQGVFLVDLNAMIFGMPRALFPALGLHHFHGGASTVGLLYAAPGAGALAAAVFMGWVASIKHQGRAVLIAVAAWGGAIVAFGLSSALYLALMFLAIAGAADVVSAVFRGTILQVRAPEELRGRLQGVQSAVVAGGPRLGDFESGTVAALAGTEFSVVSGGILCLLGVAALSTLMPRFSRYVATERFHRDVEATGAQKAQMNGDDHPEGDVLGQNDGQL